MAIQPIPSRIWTMLALRPALAPACSVCAAVLSVQHVFLPLILDWRYVVWRAFMFLPFALWLGYVIYRRPTTLPCPVVAHALARCIAASFRSDALALIAARAPALRSAPKTTPP